MYEWLRWAHPDPGLHEGAWSLLPGPAAYSPRRRKSFESLTDAYLRVIEHSGHSQPAGTNGIPCMRRASRGMWLAIFAIAACNIGTAKSRGGRSDARRTTLPGGVAGGFAGTAAIGGWRSASGVGLWVWRWAARCW